jgi:hypothetical protein
MANQELRATRDAAAGGSNTERVQVERPRNLGNLRVAMSLSSAAYNKFRVSPISFLIPTEVVTNTVLFDYSVILQDMQMLRVLIMRPTGLIKSPAGLRACVLL